MIQEMTVNGSSIQRYNARLLNYSVGGTGLNYSSSSPTATLRLPDIYNLTLSPRRVSVTLTFFPKAHGTDSSRNTTIPERLSRSTDNIVRFETDISGKVIEIGLPDGYIYKAILQTAQPPSFDATGEQDVEYIFMAIRQKAPVTKTLTSGGVIDCISNTKTPFRLTVTIPRAIGSITVCGILIRGIAANTEIIIDSEKGIITADGVNKFLDTDFVDFPYLVPGNNVINCSVSDVAITIVYTPIYA